MQTGATILENSLPVINYQSQIYVYLMTAEFPPSMGPGCGHLKLIQKIHSSVSPKS